MGIRAFGKTLQELFRNAAIGMFEQMADLETITSKKIKNIVLDAVGLEELYLAWHQELLFRSAVDRTIYNEFSFNALSEKHLEASLRGEPMNFEKHNLKKEIKAVTYHGLKVQKKGDGWVGEVIFDI